MSLSDFEVLALYAEVFGNNPDIWDEDFYDDADRAKTAQDIRDMISAPSHQAAKRVLDKWRNPENILDLVIRLRQIALIRLKKE